MTISTATATDIVLRVENVSVTYPSRRHDERSLTAVRDVTFELHRGETLGIVGESGSGKSTLARSILRLVEPSTGRIMLGDTDFTALSGRQLRDQRRRIQMVFQDPYSSLDPSMVVGESVAEPLEVHEQLDRAARRQRVAQLLRQVGLSDRHYGRHPHELSGGQRQRVAIARALAVHPDVLVCDEPVSALDVSTQNQIIVLLKELQRSVGVSYVFIAHDLAVVAHLAHRVAVMYMGEVVETGRAVDVLRAPAHPYTQALLAAVPRIAGGGRRRRALPGDPPDPAAPPPGCPFQTRCPLRHDRCTETPPVVPTSDVGFMRCHLALGVARSSSPTS